ncbi:limbic system-associated membrane protein-like [Onthophagus taurus]|uniref:limbic system-associated membrane protein-like n=1 Tax=Onthophagus taurus TaxID=166361 RepID=UPI0039BE122E
MTFDIFIWYLVVTSFIQDSLGDNPKVDPASLPMFLTSSQLFKVTEKETVVLPCEVANPGHYILAWKKGIAVLSAGSVKVSPDSRINLMNGYNLEIKSVEAQDAGDYVCQIGTLEPREITHTLEVLVPPKIQYITANGRVEAKKGTTVILECRAIGNPNPKVTWTRKNNLLPSGDQMLVTPSITLQNVDRHQAGTYQCSANNGIGEPIIEQILLHVMYPPEITVERPIVHSGEGFEAQLVCIVHGESQPEVLWYRDTMQLDTTEQRIMQSRGSRHTLVIRKVHRSDFGNYTCAADNPLGKTRKTVQLTGIPNSAKFSSASRGLYRDSYNITWAVESFSPIQEYKLLFRRLPDNLGHADGYPQPLHHQSQRRTTVVKESTMNVGYGYQHQFNDRRTDWRDVILQANPVSQFPGVQSMSYVIKGLKPGQNYEAKVEARNRYGWSPISEPFTFQTADTDMNYPERPQTPGHIYNENEIHDFEPRIYFNNAKPLKPQLNSILIIPLFNVLFFLSR